MAHMVYIIHDIWYICYISSDDNDANIIQKLVELLRIRVIQLNLEWVKVGHKIGSVV